MIKKTLDFNMITQCNVFFDFFFTLMDDMKEFSLQIHNRSGFHGNLVVCRELKIKI